MRTGRILGALLVVLASCDRSDINGYPCLNPDKGHLDANREPDPCHLHDPNAGDAGPPGDAGGTCAGECLPGAPTGWVGPALVWMGDEAAAPLCPAIAPFEGFTGHGDPIVPEVCTTCVCDPPIGSCALPAMLTAAASSCAGDGSGVAHTSFDPPANWGGTCNGENAIPTGKLCGGVPCVQSIMIAPLTMKESGCTLIETPHVPMPPSWGMFARACITTAHQPDCSEVEVCVPAAPVPEFKQCISHEYQGDPNDLECDPSYPIRSVIYDKFVDKRMCAPCSCGAPEGGACTGSISVFEDGGCKAPLFATLKLDATGAQCVDVPPGSALESKSASEAIYSSGKCAVIGGTSGKVSFIHIRVICCQGTP